MDEYQQARAWLEHVRGLKVAEERAARLMELMEGIAEGAKGIDYTREKVSGSQAKGMLEESIARIEEQRASFEASSVAYRAEANAAMDRLSSLDDPDEYEALAHHYCGGLEWSEVASLMHFSEARIYEIRRAGVLHAYDVMPDEWREQAPAPRTP